jgi:hypothetical protein
MENDWNINELYGFYDAITAKHAVKILVYMLFNVYTYPKDEKELAEKVSEFLNDFKKRLVA